MATKSKLYNMNAEEVGTLNLSDNLFAADYNEPLIHEVVVAYNANQRQGTKSTLTRSEVRGHAKKPYRQKHTGRARHGSTKSPEYKGGGVVFAPKPRDFSKKLNKQVKKIAFASAMSEKLRQNEIVFIDEFKLAEPKTKEVVKFLNAFGLNKSVVIVTDEKNADVLRAAGNLQNVQIQIAELLSTYDVVANNKVVMTKDAVKSLEEAYN
ncbi:MAG: 50S ribosomal protein L4 [Firmicutes bacterium]|nr:50S ribosomal protein L4 [Bacillota bacterium]MDY5585951.1 50S ribosomal protein L4 [Eubacteriales bacterium]